MPIHPAQLLFKILFVAPPICVPPKGHSKISEPTFWLYKTITATLRALVGERISDIHSLGRTRNERIENYVKGRSQVSLLSLGLRRDPLIYSGGKSFQIISCLSALSVFIFGKAVLLLIPLAWMWLGYELAQIELEEQRFSPSTRKEIFGTVIGKLMIVAAASCGLYVGFYVVFYLPTFGLAGWMLPFLITGLFGAYAVMVRLLRSPFYQEHPVTCQACSAPMRKLNATELRQHMSPAQHTEVMLKSTFYEGWQCQHCLPPYHPQELNIHLASYVLNQKGYQECKTCQTLTVEVTDYPLVRATKRKPGQKTEKKYCHYCRATSTQEVTIPRISRKWATSHNHHQPTIGCDSSYASGGSYGSSYESSGGSFGGGESGGGGAGDSW